MSHFNEKPAILFSTGLEFILKYLVAMTFPFIFIGCEKEKPDTGDFLILSMDVPLMAEKYLSDFNPAGEGPVWNFYEYKFERTSDSTLIFFQISICNSVAETDSVIDIYFSDIAAVYDESPFKGESAGNRFWWIAQFSPDYPSNIIFIRNNLIMILYGYKYTELLSLAKKIDYDIVHRASYITYDDN